MKTSRRNKLQIALICAVAATTSFALAAPTKKGPPKKTGAAPSASIKPAAPRAPELHVVERIDKFSNDYQAEVYSGVPLSDPYAKERGLERGLVWMAFENTRQLGFRVPKEKLRRAVRMVVEDDPRMPAGLALAQRSALLPVTMGVNAADPVPRSTPKDRVDVLDTADGTIIVTTSTSNAGIFTSSEVYVFPKGSFESDLAFAQRAAASVKERLRDALVLAHAK